MSVRGLAWALGAALVALLGGCRSTAAVEQARAVQIDVELRGVHAFPEDELRAVVLRELARNAADEPTKADVDDSAFALESFYRRQGFPFALVEYELEPRPGERARARLTVDEGPRTRVRELRLEGFSAVAPEVARSFFGAAGDGGVFDEEALEDARARVLRYYLEHGFLRVELDDLDVQLDEAREQATVTLRVHEGPSFHVRSVEFEGTSPHVAATEQGLRERTLHDGKEYGPWVDLTLRHALVEAHSRAGYPFAEVEVSSVLDEETGDVALFARTVPGDRVKVARVVVEGNVRTRTSSIQAMLDIDPGDLYDSEEVRLAFRRLYATGLFETIRIEPRGTGEERDLVVAVDEGRAVQVRVEPGWGSYEGPRMTVAVEDGNFAGRMQRLGLEGTASLRAQSARLGWVDPEFLDTHFAAEIAITPEHREEPSFEFSRVGMSFFLRRRWTVDWSTAFGYEFRPTNVSDDLAPTPLAPDINDDADVAELSAALILDDRDSPLLATRGHRARLRLAWADDTLGSQVEFVSTQFDVSQLFRIGDESVLAASARTGIIRPIGTTSDIPLPERLFNGGENSVRSFKEDELGPADAANEPIGGEGSTTINLELRRNLIGNIAGALFVDAGNVVLDWRDALDFRDLRYGIGAGIRYLLPVGPVRLDVAWNPDPHEQSVSEPFQADEDEWAIHFSVGYPF